jgi:enamidase
MTLAVINIGDSHVGDLAGSVLAGDAVVAQDGMIAWIGDSADVSARDHASVLDARGATVVPGFIDSHVHVTFGDDTPRPQTVGYLESYLHGGTTTAISASEVHVPGRPTDPAGLKALAVAAQRCFADYRPGGMRVHAGMVILEPGLSAEDFRDLARDGVWLAKAGFGAVQTPFDYVPLVADAKAAGLTVMSHTGGGSIPGSASKISAEHLLAMAPDVAGHVNGGPTALMPEENERLVAEGGRMALQLAHAGNLRSAIDIVERALAAEVFDRVLIATDTPTGTGVIPLGMMRAIAELSSLSEASPRALVGAATGHVAAAYGLDAGLLAVGRPADLLVLDAPVGSAADSAFEALAIGDLAAVCAVITEGRLRVTRSRNTPAPARAPRVLASAA